MKKILFVAQNFYIGGVQTSLVNLLKYLKKEYKDEYEIDLFTFGKGELISQLPEDINIFYGKTMLSLASAPFMKVISEKNPLHILLRIFLMIAVRIIGTDKFYRIMLKNQKIFSGYDTAISYFDDIPGCFFNKGTNMFVSDYVNCEKRVAWIHTDLLKSGFNREYCLNLYKRFDEIICVSDAVRKKFETLLPEYRLKTRVFHNIVSNSTISELSYKYIPFKKDKFSIVTVCRIDNKSKRTDEIVKICRRLKDDNITDFIWRIVGSGPDLKSNIKLSKELGVTDVLEFTGEKINPYPYVRHSDLFALYSAYEGYPMVIAEALALDKFILTTNYAAAKEQIDESRGYICCTDDEFYDILKKTIFNKKIQGV